MKWRVKLTIILTLITAAEYLNQCSEGPNMILYSHIFDFDWDDCWSQSETIGSNQEVTVSLVYTFCSASDSASTSARASAISQ